MQTLSFWLTPLSRAACREPFAGWMRGRGVFRASFSIAHEFGVSEGIELARALKRLHLVVYGIEGRSFALGERLSPEVEAAAAEVVRRVKDELEACRT
jgi:Ni,Fe-hydrogenase maturation factor